MLFSFYFNQKPIISLERINANKKVYSNENDNKHKKLNAKPRMKTTNPHAHAHALACRNGMTSV